MVLFLDPVHRSLALPSGTLLISTGLLGFLEDEAELVFVLGHEIAHAASGDAAVRLSRLGFAASARRRGDDSDESWAEAAMDLVRLGYGRRRERDADTRAAEAVTALGYDPESIARYLARCSAAIAERRARPRRVRPRPSPAADRAMRIERGLYGRIGSGGHAESQSRAVPSRAATGSLPEEFVPVQLGELARRRRPAAGTGRAAWRWGSPFSRLAGAAFAGLVYLLR